MIGQTVSHYRVDQRLGEGGMGVLYGAEDLRLGRRVALKFLRDEAGQDDASLDRFRREARAASALSNPHICTVHDVGLHEGRPFIVMELLEGTTLAYRLKEGPLPTGELLDLALQMADALSAAHGKGIVHRDLKPGNVFLTDSGLLKVLDFGVAKLQREPTGQTTSVRGLQAALLENDGGRATATGLVLGTLPYMSPEQARGREIDARSDLFSFGAVLYEMATGSQAFTGGSAKDVIDAVLNHTPLPPSRLRPGLPPELEGVILRALEKHRDARCQSAAEMVECLRPLHGETRGANTARHGWSAFWRQPRSALLAAASRWRRPGPGPASARIESLAVMPLQALSSEEDQELLADGITDALISHLSQVRAVRVISRTSVLRYKGTTKAVPQIARELGVDGVVEGSLLLSGGRVRVTARLIHAAQDRSVWSRTYERELRDVLALQSELAQAVAREIRVALTPEERRRLVHTRPVDPEAHFSFLRGQFHSNRGSPADLEKALREFQAAAERDPTFAPAWAGIGWTYTWLAGAAYGVLPPRDAMPLAQAAARRALEIEPSAGAHATLAYVAERYEFDFVRAEQEFGRALELDPGSAAAHEALAEHLTKLGRFDDAIAEATTALELDPFSLTTRTNLAWRHYLARRFEEAARLARQTLSLEPAFAYSRLLLGMSLLAMGRDHEALLEFELFRSMSPGDPLGLVVVAHARARVGDTQAALELLAELEALGERRYVGADRLAWIFAGLRDTERCLASWERAFEERSPLLSHLAVLPAVDDLRSDPRFQDLVRRVGLPSADLRPSSARSNGVQAR